MAEQYIYSRAEKEITNALHQTVPVGFGFIRLSPGMNKAMRDAVKDQCEDCPWLSQRDGQGVPLPLFRKACLPKGQALLQKSAWITGEGRDFHVAHGYVLEDGELRESGPGNWFDIRFQLGNPNVEPLEVPLGSWLEFEEGEPFCAKPMKETMEFLGLGRTCFHQMLLACFDAVVSRRQVLVAWDFERPAEWEFRRSLLYWLYICLPYGLWSILGFDSVYTAKSIPGLVQFAFVDKESIQDGLRTPSIRLENQMNPLGGNFLIQDGVIFHNDSKYPAEWYGQDGAFARWLEQLVNMFWECPVEELPSNIQVLSDFHRSFQELLDTREGQLNPQWYGTVCIKALDGAPQVLSQIREQVQSGVTEGELYDFRLAFMDTFSEAERQGILKDLLEAHQKRGAPMEEKEAKMLGALFESGLKVPAAGLAGAFMAQEADAPGASITQVLNDYQKALPLKLYSALLEPLFFSGLRKEEAALWADCGVNNSEAAAKQRRAAWFAEKIPVDKPVQELPASINQALGELKGLNDQQRAKLWQEPFQEWCGNISEEVLDAFADEQMPQNFRELKNGFFSLPGGIPEGALDTLLQKAYSRLLSAFPPFIDGRWLKEASNGWKTSGEAGEALEILNAFTNKGQGDVASWEFFVKDKSDDARRMAVAVLPKVFLNGALPKIQGGFLMIFLFLCPKDSQKILLQAARQGGGQLLLSLLNGARKYPWKHFGRLKREDPFIFYEIVQVISKDQEIADAVREKDGGSVRFYKDLKKFLQEPETERMLSSYDISACVNALGQISHKENRGGRREMSKQRR